MPRSGVRSLLRVMEKARMVSITQKVCRVRIKENSEWNWGWGTQHSCTQRRGHKDLEEEWGAETSSSR